MDKIGNTQEGDEYTLTRKERELMYDHLTETLQSEEFDAAARELATLYVTVRDSISNKGLQFHRKPDDELGPEACWYLNRKLDDELAMAASTLTLCSMMISDSVGDKVPPDVLEDRIREAFRRVRLITQLMLDHGVVEATSTAIN